MNYEILFFICLGVVIIAIIFLFKDKIANFFKSITNTPIDITDTTDDQSVEPTTDPEPNTPEEEESPGEEDEPHEPHEPDEPDEPHEPTDEPTDGTTDEQATTILTGDAILQYINNYQGLVQNPNHLVIGIANNLTGDNYIFKNSTITTPREKILTASNFIKTKDFDLFFHIDFFTTELATTSPKVSHNNGNLVFDNKYKEYFIDYSYNVTSQYVVFQSNVFFNSKLKVELIRGKNIKEINSRKYYYSIFKIINYTNNTQTVEDFNYILNIVPTLVKPDDEEEIKKLAGNSIYALDNAIRVDENIKYNDHFDIKYTDRIIAKGDYNGFRGMDNDKGNVKYLLLNIQNKS